MKPEIFPCFRRDNTVGFSQEELDQLNSAYERAVEDEEDEDRRARIAERLLEGFKSTDERVVVEGQVFTDPRHVRFVRDMEDAGYTTFAYSGRGMFGAYCPAVRCGGDDHPSEQDVYRATALKLSQDSLGRGTVLYAR